MIDKLKIGKRIIALRKELGYSQSDFADKLNVTPQAVSKWETGSALPDIEILLVMSGLFKISINEILVGKNVLYQIANRPFEMPDIAYFVEARDLQWEKSVIEGDWVNRNWEWRKNEKVHKNIAPMAKRIIDHGGLILQLAVGPGGGLMTDILFEKHDAQLIISDISPAIVCGWKKVFDRDFFPPNVSYAALDNCDLPFEDNSIDVVAIAGFGNTEGDKHRAVREIYRVLKPGGLFALTDGFVTQERFKAYSDNVQKIMMDKIGWIFEDYYETSIASGFKTIDNILQGDSVAKGGGDSVIGDLAEELGVELVLTWYTRYCIK